MTPKSPPMIAVLFLLWVLVPEPRPTEAASGALTPRSADQGSHPPTATTEPPSSLSGGFLPGFIENRGQWDPSVAFGVWAGPTATLFRDDGWTLGAPGTDGEQGWAVGFSFENRDAGSVTTGEDQRRARLSFLHGGEDPIRDVPTYDHLLYRDLYPGVGMRVLVEDGHIRYDVLLEPGADLSAVIVRCDGTNQLSYDAGGDLLLETPIGALRQTAPIAWQSAPDGTRRPVNCRFRLVDERRFGFEATGLDPSLPLTVDPGIVWSLRAGGYSTGDVARDVAIGPNGDVYITGSGPNDFPTTSGAYSPSGIGAFVARISANGSWLVASTFLGGSQSEGRALAFSGNDVIVTGTTGQGFPTTSGTLSPPNNGGTDTFLARMDSALSSLICATHLGGSSLDEPTDLAVSPTGDILVCGKTASTDFPTSTHGAQLSYVGGYEGYAAVLSSGLDQLLYGTYLAGLADEAAQGIASAPLGDIIVVGYTESANFQASSGAYQATKPGGSRSGFAARFSPAASTSALSTVYSTFLGGTASDEAAAVDVSASGAAVIVGRTDSIDFPTTGSSLSPTHNGPPPVGTAPAGLDGFVTRLDPSGAALEFSTFLGGSSSDWPKDVAIDPSEVIYVGGITNSPDFPTTPGALAVSPYSGSDTFIARISPYGDSLLYGTFLGGISTDDFAALAVDPSGDVVAIGVTGSANYPVTPGTASTPFNATCVSVFGTWLSCPDLFLTRLDLLPSQAQRIGTATGTAPTPPQLSVAGTIQSPGPDARVILSGAPPLGIGLLGIGSPTTTAGIPTAGIILYVDVFQNWYPFSMAAGPTGYLDLPMPVPAGTSGYTFALQAVWDGTATWGGGPGIPAATPGLLVTIP